MAQTQVQVSCPHCDKLTVVDMNLEDMPPMVQGIMDAMGVKSYNFGGRQMCECGRLVCVTLTITSGERNDDVEH